MTRPAGEGPFNPSEPGRPRPRRPRNAAERALAEQMLKLLRAGADLRTARVRRLRESIDAGAYENDLKLEIAIEQVIRKSLS